MRGNPSITHKKMQKLLIFLMITTLLISYIAFTGLSLNKESTAKNSTRLIAAIFGLCSVMISGKLPISLLATVLLGSVLLLINKNPLITNIIFILFYITILSKTKITDISKICFYSTAIGCSFHIYLILTNSINNETIEVGDRVRFLFGFSNPNQLAALYYSLFLSALFVAVQLPSKRNITIFIASTAISLPFIYLADSRTNLMAMALTTIWVIIPRGIIMSTVSRYTTMALPFSAMILSIFLATDLGTPLNDPLSNRPYFFNLFITNLSEIDLLIGWANKEEVTIDNAYLILLSTVGLPLTMTIIGNITYKIKILPSKFIPIIGVLLALSITESVLIRPEIPASIIFLSILYSNKYPRQHTPSNDKT